MHDEFDPAYGLEGEGADSILDWERRMVVKAAGRCENLRVRYISPCRAEVRGPTTDDPPVVLRGLRKRV